LLHQDRWQGEIIMEDNRASQPAAQPRRFAYRATDPEGQPSHPMRRSSDTPRPFQGVVGELCPRLQVLQMRVYLKLN
jgi:hypothetical protein